VLPGLSTDQGVDGAPTADACVDAVVQEPVEKATTTTTSAGMSAERENSPRRIGARVAPLVRRVVRCRESWGECARCR
jgi:hypothetical protein